MELPQKMSDIWLRLLNYRNEEKKFPFTEMVISWDYFIRDLRATPEGHSIEEVYKVLLEKSSDILNNINYLKKIPTSSPSYSNAQEAIAQLTPILTELEQLANTISGQFADLSTDLILRDLSDLEKGIQEHVPSEELLQKHTMIAQRVIALPQPGYLTTSKTFGDPEVIKMFPLESIKAFFNFYTALLTLANQLRDRSLWQVNMRIDSILSQLEEDPRKVSVRTVFFAVTDAQELLDEEIGLKPF